MPRAQTGFHTLSDVYCNSSKHRFHIRRVFGRRFNILDPFRLRKLLQYARNDESQPHARDPHQYQHIHMLGAYGRVQRDIHGRSIRVAQHGNEPTRARHKSCKGTNLTCARSVATSRSSSRSTLLPTNSLLQLGSACFPVSKSHALMWSNVGLSVTSKITTIPCAPR